MSTKELFLAWLWMAVPCTGIAQHACQDMKATSAAGVPNLDHRALSDTFDILHTALELDFTRLPANNLKARAELTVKRLQNTPVFSFELDSYTIDSAHVNGQPATLLPAAGGFRRIGSLPADWAIDSTAIVEIWYRGAGPADPTGWGGWHMDAPYFYNLGVGFGANPHSYGRSLFPAFDNFVEHSTYAFSILTLDPRKAYANGSRTQLLALAGDTILQNWICTDPLPAYLVSVAISNYVEIRDTLQTNSGTVPSLVLARPADTAKVAGSFANLQGILSSFESWYGDYVWDKVGYALTPVGAMEHATSIHMPVHLIDGTKNGEDIVAHELAHHWWGNLVTCRTAGDMWINEGMAEFSSHLYLEDVYDRDRYLAEVRANHFMVLNRAHFNDGGHLALSAVDHGTTYGTHVYNKGAWVGHNMRGLLGDSVFRSSMHQLFTNHAFGNLSTDELETVLSQHSGRSMTGFFSDWIRTPGHVAVAIDSLRVQAFGNEWTAVVGLSQHARARTTTLSEVPLSIRFYDAQGNFEVRKYTMKAAQAVPIFTNLPFSPDYATVNEGGEFITATTTRRVEGIGFGIYDLTQTKMQIVVNNSTDTHRIYTAHHWAGPGAGPTGMRTSTSRFWTIAGTWDSNFDATARFFYDARVSSFGHDADLLQSGEDSLILLYRQDASEPWSIYPHYTKDVMGNPGDGYGRMDLSLIKAGQYVLANASPDIGFHEETLPKNPFRVFPNPSNGEIILEQYAHSASHGHVNIVDMRGRAVWNVAWEQTPGWNRMTVQVELPSGSYLVSSGSDSEAIVVD